MVRAASDLAEFEPRANVAAQFANQVGGDGASAQAAAQVFSGLADTLGRIADKSAADRYEKLGKQVTADAIGLPQTRFTKTPGAGGAAAAEAGGLSPSPPASAPEPNPLSRRAPTGGKRRADIIRAAARELGTDPVDLATVISYETGGTFSTRIRGGKDNKYIGLIQFGPEEQKRYGARQGQSFEEQMGAVVRYLKHRGFKPGMSLANLYSTINAGSPGRFQASDRPGYTVARHVQDMRGAHRLKAINFLGRGGAGEMTDAALPALFDRGAAPATAGAPQPDTFTAQTFVPEPKPLALRRDGTIAGDAYDRAVNETAAWRLSQGIDAEFAQAARDHQDDPVAWMNARDDIFTKYREQGGAIGPEMQLALEQRMTQRIMTYDADIAARAEKKADDGRKQAAGAALVSAVDGLERQAYLIGTAKDGDQRLADISRQSLAAIDAAEASGALDPAEAAVKRGQIGEALVRARVQGVFDALPGADEKARFVQGLAEEYRNPQSPLSRLDPGSFRALTEQLAADARQAKTRDEAALSYDRQRFARLAADDVESLERTGKGLEIGGKALDAREVARVLGPERAAVWAEKRAEAKALHDATAGLELMTPEAIAERLTALEPKAGEEGFATKAKIFDAVEKQADRLLKARLADPAAAAEAFPQVAAVRAAIDAKEATPADLIAARIDAQTVLGVPGTLIEPLTRAEAKAEAKRFMLYQGSDEELQQRLEGMADEMRQRYGAHGADVMRQILGQYGLSRARAQASVEILDRLAQGNYPDPREMRGLSRYVDAETATDAMDGRLPERTPQPDRLGRFAPQGKKKLPNIAQVNHLRRNPGLAAEFDKSFGEGAAEQYLKAAPPQDGQPVTRQLPDGGWEVMWPNGYVEVTNAQGELVKGYVAPEKAR